MKAAVLTHPAPIAQKPLRIEDVPQPTPGGGHVLLKVRACGVCRTDLHIVEGELPPRIENDDSRAPDRRRHRRTAQQRSLPLGTRVGVSWIGGTDGTCWYCRHEMENLCDDPTFTGYTVPGGYAEYALARADFVFPLPRGLDDLHAAPLLCAGHHRLSRSARRRRRAGRARGTVWLRSVGAPCHRGAARLEVRRLCVDPGSIASQAGGVAGREVGGRGSRQASGRSWIAR